MNKTKQLLVGIYELFFPREKSVAMCDKVTRDILEKLAVRVFVETHFSCIAPLPYKHPLVKNMIYASKYHSHAHASSVLGEVLSSFLSEELAEKQMFGVFEEPVCIAIPLHKTRFRERGYNQALRIQQSILTALDIKAQETSEILIRNKSTLSQSQSRNKKERFQNMKDAFSVPNPKEVAGKDVVLIDDVVTTGATFLSAKKALLKAGAREVLCVAAAH